MQQMEAAAQRTTRSDGPEERRVYQPTNGRARLMAVLDDVRRGLELSRLSVALGWLDIKLRYRGSILGPFWLTLSTAVMIAALGVLYARLFHMPFGEYLPFLSISLVMWSFISTVWGEGAMIFVDNAGLILSSDVPFTVYITRAVIRNFIVMAHNVVVIAIVFYLCDVTPRHDPLILAGFALWFVDSLAVMTLLGVLGARFRDVGPTIATVLQIFFFITPVMWKPELAHSMEPWLIYNPFYPLIEIVRLPAMGQALPIKIWEAALIHSAILMVVAFLIFARFRARLAYWV
ncbi:ABC transporter permease [Sorlinia euscelidii]